MYEYGEGVPQDYVQAHMWYNLAAAASGDAKYDKSRDSLAEKMTSPQIVEAQRLAREWRPNSLDQRRDTGAVAQQTQVENGHKSDAEIKQEIIADSISSYRGSCPCPYNIDRAGRSCGLRSAYSRPGGASPTCYPADVSQQMVDDYRRRHEN